MAIDADAADAVEEFPETEVTATGSALDAVTAVSQDDDEANDRMETDEGPAVDSSKTQRSPAQIAVALGVLMCLTMGGLVGWLGFRAYQSHQQRQQQTLFVQVARQGAVNLTTIDYTRSDADIQRILDSATGQFYDDFSQRSKPFIDVVKQAQSKSEGTVTEAGLESDHGDTAQVLIAVAVKTSNAGAQDQQPRAWRMRMTVQKIGADAKVANVEFVP
jgi:Mce-associated membrane protein